MNRSPTRHWTTFAIVTALPSLLTMTLLWDDVSRDDIGAAPMVFTLTVLMAVVAILFLPLALLARRPDCVISGCNSSHFMGVAIIASQAVAALVYMVFHPGRMRTLAVLIAAGLISTGWGFATRGHDYQQT